MWQVRSPDLSLCDYFFWVYLKAEVCKRRTTSVGGLKAAIRQIVGEIRQEMLRQVIKNYRNLIHQCITFRERHLKDTIFKTTKTKSKPFVLETAINVLI